MRKVVRMILILICVWIAWMIIVWMVQHSIMFPRGTIGPDRLLKHVPEGIESLWLDTDNGKRVEAWLIPGEGASADKPGPAVVFAHGNGEVIDDNLDLRWLADLGATVLLVEYRGYGRSSGAPSQRKLVDDTSRFVELLKSRPEVDPDRVAYLGRSIGTGVLAQVARDHVPTAMIMLVPPARLDKMAWRFGVPPFLVRSPFRSDLAVRDLDAPILILARDRDGIIPSNHAGMLHEASPRSELIMLNGTHNWLDDDDEMRRERNAMHSFLLKHGILEAQTTAQP
ncbi:MAG: alpha/beta fold hydrolase [Phycisphaerales bacterium]|nr:alpha/beta fold hydrolase [Phycisphaerales bacterium]